ncbi:MAG: ribonuclease D, partial [Candidatus Sumerlaeota bacterium]
MTTSPPSLIEFDYIDSVDGLAHVVELCHNAERVAIDTEADSLHHYFEKVCLIQISVGDSHVIVDPLALEDISSLLDVLADKT